MELIELGWDAKYEAAFTALKTQGLEPARVIAEHKERYVIAGYFGDMPAEVTGKFMHAADKPSDFPKTGDWVAVSVFKDENKAIIHSVLPRRTCFSRKAAGRKTEEQVIDVNIDILFIVRGLDGNYNPMRLLRYCSALQGTGIEPIVVLNKSDIRPDSEKVLQETTQILQTVKTVPVSARTGAGLEALKAILGRGKTFALAGSSGAGKSTIINALAGGVIAKTGKVRQADSRGRHVTVTRQLYMLGEYGMLIDTPGMREMGLWATDAGGPAFDIVEEYAKKCRFRDCTHNSEPGCAVRDAVEAGEIPQKVFASRLKLKREAEFNAAKADEKAAMDRKKKEKKFGKLIKETLGNNAKYRGRKQHVRAGTNT
ncbi:MAG: ribosome small subunit-dependent GTPase A [Spirochaetia bacterium]|nr:ribosome small subunit-dependent GTPase A [Spirochaetia bacterium]